jgi:hypothetical protein
VDALLDVLDDDDVLLDVDVDALDDVDNDVELDVLDDEDVLVDVDVLEEVENEVETQLSTLQFNAEQMGQRISLPDKSQLCSWKDSNN